jgi:hypothetical protein
MNYRGAMREFPGLDEKIHHKRTERMEMQMVDGEREGI